MATQLAERTANPVDVFRQTLTQPAFVEQLKMALPNHIPVDRFIRVAQTAVQNNPDLLNPQKVERRSLFGALTKAAQDGLLPDGREGAIIPFKGKAVWQPMVAGIMKKVRNSGQITNWETAPVFEKDTFERLLGDDQRIYHKPYEDGDPGDVVGAYSIVTLKDGSKSRDYLPRWRIDKALAQNPMGANSLMRTKFFDEAAVKTVIKHHAKRLPMSTDVEALIERDEFMTPSTGYTRQPEAPAEIAPPPPVSRLDALEHHIQGEAVDAETGEITDPPVEPPEITEQAEEVEAEIDADAAAEATEPTPAEEAVERVIGQMDAATKADALEKIVKETQQHRTFIPDDLLIKLDIAIDRNRRRLEPQTEAAK